MRRFALYSTGILIIVLIVVSIDLFQKNSARNIPYPPWEYNPPWTGDRMEEIDTFFKTWYTSHESRFADLLQVPEGVKEKPRELSQFYDSRTAEDFAVVLKASRLEKESQSWKIVSAPGRMNLPAVFIQAPVWSGDTISFLILPDRDLSENSEVMDYIFLWKAMTDRNPKMAFTIMANDSKRREVRTVDLLRALTAKGYYPGDKLREPIPKELWRALYKSKNPCYRIIALEYFDSVPQSEEEGLAISRECLLSTCSYFELRAMRYLLEAPGDKSSKITLLQEYIDSEPLDNDGTGYWSRPLNVVPGYWGTPLKKRAAAAIHALKTGLPPSEIKL